MENVISILEKRGLLEAETSPDIREMTQTPQVVYAGFDPTSDSLQAGNLVAVMMLAHFQRGGHRVIAVVGGATGRIGDPSGKAAERQLLTNEQIEQNLKGIRENLERFLDFDHPTAPAIIVNNNDWMSDFTFVDFLRDVGKHFRMGRMLSKDSVRTRLESDEGMSFCEFSYQVLQGYDFLHLYRNHKCTIQVGGSDQWGNITAGIDLVHKLAGAAAFGVTAPLVCDSSGQKFGKSEGNAVYLSAARTSIYQFYQYFIRTEDADVIRFLKIFTFLPIEEIETLERSVQEEPGKREAQKRLAAELTQLVHGEEGLAIAQKASEVLFGGSLDGCGAAELLTIFAHVPSHSLSPDQVRSVAAVDVAVEAGLAKSKGEMRRLIQNGGFYVNNVRVESHEQIIENTDIIEDRVLILRSGKKKYHLVELSG